MRYIVLFQHSCDACSKVARMVGDVSIGGLEARALEDPQVTALLSNAHLQTPGRPSLLIINGDDVQVLSGWAMRRRLASVVGWRRSGTILRLLAAEWRARLARAAEPHGPSRRGVIGGALAGLGGWALMSGAAAASPAPGEGKPDIMLADPAEVEKALATAPVQQAIRTWGPVEGQAFKTSGSGAVLALTHPERGILTVVDNSPGALRGGNPVALSFGHAPTAEHGLRYYTVTGAPLADQVVSGSRVITTAVQHNPDEVIPDFNFKTFSICFTGCIGVKGIQAECLNGCFSCGIDLVNHSIPGILSACPPCLKCAGVHAYTCAKSCANLAR
jgi:hypothetical protein